MRGQRSRRSDGGVQQAAVGPHSPQQVQGESGSRRLPDSDAQAALTTANFLYDIQEVARTVIQGGGVKHLVTMATSEHMIMQNEALVALGLIAGLDLGETPLLFGFFFSHHSVTGSGQRSLPRLYFLVLVSVSAEKDFVGANLVSVLHKLLSDEKSAPEIKYNSMILICAVMGSGQSNDHFAHKTRLSLDAPFCKHPLPALSSRAPSQRGPEPGLHRRGIQAEGSRQ